MNTKEFFEAIFGSVISADRRLSIFVIPGKQSSRFSSVDAAADFATSHGERVHVYHAMGAIYGDPEGRGKADDTCGVGALWCDLDIQGDAHKGSHIPSSTEEAEGFLLSLPVPPSIIVDSGNGLHGYWPLDIPLVYATRAQRTEAAKICKRWHQFICDQAASSGWKIENLGDLARVLRVPGTWNSKTSPARMASVIHATGELFEIGKLLEHIKPEEPQKQPARQHVTTIQPAGQWSPLERCKMYLDSMEPAIEGQEGGTKTLLACKAIFRFGLSGLEARAAFDHYNARCVPLWTDEKQIAHKLDDAEKSVAGAGEIGILLGVEQTSDPIADGAAAAILNASLQPRQLPYKPIERDNPGAFPTECLDVPGLVGDVMAHNLRTAMYPQPELALAGALALLAVITGRKIADERGTRTNLYALGISPSGSGKEHARAVNKNILIRASQDGERMLGPERIGSSAGLVSSVAAQPAILFHLDEFGKMLATMRNANKAPHLFNISAVLMQLYSSSSTIWVGDAYADLKKTKRIVQPHACVYGTGTPDEFWAGLSKENLSDGLLGRLLVFEGRLDVDPTEEPPEDPPEEILSTVRRWLEFRPSGGNLGDCVAGKPFIVPRSGAAAKRLREHFIQIASKRKSEDSTRAAVWSRSGEKTAKLALLFACSRWDVDPAIGFSVEIEDVNRAIKIVNWITRKMLFMAEEHVSENDNEARSKKLLRSIVGEMTMTELNRKTRWLRPRDRREVLEDLQSCGDVVLECRETSGRPVTYVRRSC